MSAFAEQQPQNSRGDLYLLFSMGGDRYALDVHEVVEVLPLRRCKALAEAPPWLLGLFEHRGESVPVVDLCVRAFARPALLRASTRLVLVRYGAARRLLGLILEQATETLRLPADAFRPLDLNVGPAHYLGPVQDTPQGLVQRIEVAGLLPADVAARLFAAPESSA